MRLVKNILLFIINRLPRRNIVVFESAPDLSDNTKAVFDEMVKRGLNYKHKLYWICFDEKVYNYPKIKNVKYLSAEKISTKYIIRRARCAICCNRFVVSSNKKAVNIYLCHGNPLKNTKDYYMIPKSVDYILASSKGMADLRCSFYGYDNDKFIILGYPRNDVLTNAFIDLHSLFDIHFKKVIVWYPTVRQFKSGRTTGSEHALPIIWDIEKAIEINNCAKANDVLIVLKPHFAQNINAFKKLNLSNVAFIDDSFFKSNNISSYQFVASCDALLTDFSSIYYDYTLCDKPIGLIWEDYNQYKTNPGFIVDMEYMMKGGVKIFNMNDFKSFVKDVSSGIDRLKEERREIRDFSNISNDGFNSKRVVDYIVKVAYLREEKMY